MNSGMKKSTTSDVNKCARGAVAAGILAVTVIMFGAGGCESPTSDDNCKCPNGTVHESGACSCAGDGCVCETKETSLGYNITLENQTGSALGDVIGYISDALDAINSDDPTLMTNITPRNVRIIVTNGTSPGTDGSNTITIGKKWLSSAFDTKLHLYSHLGSISITLDRVNPSIRLAMTGDAKGGSHQISWRTATTLRRLIHGRMYGQFSPGS
jgi:hypothetical protein